MQRETTSRDPRVCLRGLAILLGCTALAVGCSESNWSIVEGEVKLGGKTFGPGYISFTPTDPEAPGGGFGEIGADGHYSVRSSGRKAGLASGEYQVTISDKLEIADELDPGVRRKAPKGKIPPKYSRTSTSGLTRTIEPGAQTLDFDLEE